MKDLEVLAVIPARGGSTGIKRKNLKPLNGTPLIGWTIHTAQQSKLVSRTLVSTEDQEIADYAKSQGAEVPFIRPDALAVDSVHSVHVVLHALDWLEEHEGYIPDIVAMLLPTNPFRQVHQLDESIERFQASDAITLVSVEKLKRSLVNFRRMQSNGQVIPYATDLNLNLQRQDREVVYAVNACIYLACPKSLRKFESFHARPTLGYVMDTFTSIDIDSPEDFALAQCIASADLLKRELT